ncbi:hypothetical protein SCP_1303750 [Sparassis crispa]|uniref:Uncharacterized protein n=1 Tax=Sparassis crispa TaxID=139825 RepID=A0A401H2C3_9APHY|nr:hypothetical protein SCP_1303750 [Sparassis crispa]GBE88558.1 hypothetical protein SCP_1303750 [Sparassis crispa]
MSEAYLTSLPSSVPIYGLNLATPSQQPTAPINGPSAASRAAALPHQANQHPSEIEVQEGDPEHVRELVQAHKDSIKAMAHQHAATLALQRCQIQMGLYKKRLRVAKEGVRKANEHLRVVQDRCGSVCRESGTDFVDYSSLLQEVGARGADIQKTESD